MKTKVFIWSFVLLISLVSVFALYQYVPDYNIADTQSSYVQGFIVTFEPVNATCPNSTQGFRLYNGSFGDEATATLRIFDAAGNSLTSKVFTAAGNTYVAHQLNYTAGVKYYIGVTASAVYDSRRADVSWDGSQRNFGCYNVTYGWYDPDPGTWPFESVVYAANRDMWGINFSENPQTAPVLSGMNCTSCNIPNGDITPPFTTTDTTPTFKFNTDIITNCRIGDEAENYTTMSSSRQCTTGEGELSHICTLTTQDELIYSTDYVYISCINSLYSSLENSSGALEMEITGLTETSGDALEQGIEASAIWPGATTYSNQQVYLRNLDNDQILATVDKVAVYGNQRWILNYISENETAAGLFNITPAVYVLEMTNLSSSAIKTTVETFINSTKA